MQEASSRCPAPEVYGILRIHTVLIGDQKARRGIHCVDIHLGAALPENVGQDAEIKGKKAFVACDVTANVIFASRGGVGVVVLLL
jgi:hypothetical protein